MRIEKRLPFGFLGDWGKLYKRYTEDKECTVDGNRIIEYEQNYYVDIGMDVQFKRVPESTRGVEQPTQGIVNDAEYTVVETTDAYWHAIRRCYECVIEPGDIVKVFGRLWIVTGIRTVIRRTPAEQKFFYCDIKSIM